MKKIFTLIFSMGLLTAAFAQDGHQRNKRDNAISQSYSHDRGTKKSYGTTPFMNSNVWDSQLTRDHDSRGGKDLRFNDDRRDWSYGRGRDDIRSQRNMRKKHSRKYQMPTPGFQISFQFGR